MRDNSILHVAFRKQLTDVKTKIIGRDLNNKYDQLLSFLCSNCYLKVNYTVLFELDFDVKFPLLRLLQFLIDLKSTVKRRQIDSKIKCFHVNDLKNKILVEIG